MENLSSDFATNDVTEGDNAPIIDSVEAPEDAASITIADPSDSPVFSRCGCCMHQSFDFGHNRGRPEASPEIIADVFDRESEEAANDREAENRESKNLDENSEEADERSEDETSTVLMDTDDFTDDVNTTGVLVPDGTVTTGNIEVEGDSDWFAIEVIAGNTYNVDFSTLPSGPDLEFSLYDLSLIHI